MRKTIVLVGGGHAHLTILAKLKDYIAQGFEVVLVSPVTHHYYSGMGPGMLSQIYRPEEVRFHVEKMALQSGARFVKDKVVKIDAEKQEIYLETGTTQAYDVVSFNTGSSVPLNLFENVPNVFPVKPIVNLLKAQKSILDAIETSVPNIVVIGAGPAGVELTGNVHRLVSRNGGQANITLIAGKQILKGFPAKAQEMAGTSLSKRGINIINDYLDKAAPGEITLKSGRKYQFDFLFPAIGVEPASIFRESGLPVGADGGLLVNAKLHSTAYSNVFGGGDCISLDQHPIDKVGVYAVRQNPILFQNIAAAATGGAMESFVPQDTYMLIFNMGDDSGIFVRKSLVFNTKLSFMLKDYIDRSFMKKFQISGELTDSRVILD